VRSQLIGRKFSRIVNDSKRGQFYCVIFFIILSLSNFYIFSYNQTLRQKQAENLWRKAIEVTKDFKHSRHAQGIDWNFNGYIAAFENFFAKNCLPPGMCMDDATGINSVCYLSRDHQRFRQQCLIATITDSGLRLLQGDFWSMMNKNSRNPRYRFTSFDRLVNSYDWFELQYGMLEVFKKWSNLQPKEIGVMGFFKTIHIE